jgi:two-component system, LytTR family, sensor kinase
MITNMHDYADDESVGEPWWKKRWVESALILCVWSLVALFFCGQVYFIRQLMDHPEQWKGPFFQQISYCVLWALATPLVIHLARRFPVERSSWRRSLPIHIIACSVLSFALMCIYSISLFLWINWGIKPYSALNTLRSAIFDFSQAIGIYCLIILIVHALNYYRRYQAEVLSRSQIQSQLSQAQLQALKMQLHPHFLFNTLHSISALLNEDTEAARSMIARLGDFLRLTLENSGTQEVSLQKEMDFLKCYLEIERIRFQDRLTTLLDVEPQALDVQVPNLILQPIVENAIRHGIAPRSTPGQIEIQAKHFNGMLRIRVRDNGPGLSVNPIIKRVNGKGLGLANTRARLEQLYGAAHHFELVNAPDGGLIVTLDIPVDSAGTSRA